uniref:Uncharacterized protein n=1 Tax=viral metagenome TaxID=1070528 RepID=A0A6C0H8L6_9ZZZZ
MSIFDIQLQDIYEQLVGLNAFDNISNNTLIKANTSINSYLYVSSTAILNNNVTINSNLNVLGNMIVSNNATINSSLFVSNNSIINNNLICNSNMFVSGNTNIQNNLIVSGNTMLNNTITINSSLNVSGITQLNQGIITNNIGALNNSLSFYANNIYLGTTNSIIYFQGSTTYIASSQLLLFNKIISLNSITTNTGIDIGNDAGIEILGTSGVGYIKTNSDASRFIIQSPLVSALSYIAIQDIDNNINISGSSFFNSVSILSSLTVSGVSTIYNISGLSSLIVNNNSFFNGTISSNGLLNVSGDTIITGNNSILGNINVSNITIFNGPTTVLSDLNVLGNVICRGNTTILGVLNVSNNSILQGSTAILYNLNSLGLNILNGLVSFNSNLYISTNSIFNNTVSINSSLYVSGNSIINNSLSINSNINISGPIIINSNITFCSTINLNGSILLQLPHYIDNTTAKNNGIPLYGFYRTGGIVKIRLNDDPPTITLKGNSTVSINYGSAYTDLGISITSPAYTNLYGYIYSIGSGTTNIITNNILVSGTTTITNTSSLTSGSYLVSYSASDPDGFISYNSRNLIVPAVPSIITLKGNSTVSISYGSAYTDLGISINSSVYTNVYGYIYSIGSDTINIITNNILVSGTTTITNTTSLTSGSYLVSYIATDPYGFISYNNRNLIVLAEPSKGIPIIPVSVSAFANTINPNASASFTWVSNVAISYDGSIIAVNSLVSLTLSVSVYQIQNNIWTLLGNSINIAGMDDSNYNQYCYLSYDGLTVAVSLQTYKGTATGIRYQGQAQVYSYNGSAWIQKGQTIYGNTSVGSRMGTNIYISQDTNILTLAYQIDSSTTTGALQVFKYNINQWTQLGNIINYLSSSDGTCAWSASNSGLINSFSAYNSNANIQNYTLVSRYNPISLQWEQLGSLITQYKYPSLQYARFGRLSGDGYTVLVCSIINNWFGTLFYNNVDWIMVSSSTISSVNTYAWTSNSFSYDDMIIATMYSSRVQLLAYNNSTWSIITTFDYYPSYNNITNCLAISGNGNYVICSGSGNGQPVNRVSIRTYKINYA